MTYLSTPPPPPTIAPSGVKPRKLWDLIGALLIAAGIIGAVSLGFVGVKNLDKTVKNFARLKAPTNGPAVLQVKRSGEFWVFYEYISRFEGTDYATGKSRPSGFKVTVTDPDGKAVALNLDVPNFTYPKLGDFEGRVEASFNVTKPGDYMIEVAANDKTPFVVTVGRSGLGTLAKYVLGAIAVGLLGLGTGLATLIVTGVKRGRRKREQQARAAHAYPGGYGPPGGGQPSPYQQPPAYGAPPPPSPYGSPPLPSPAPAPAPSPWVPPGDAPSPPPRPGDGGPWAPPSP